MPGAGELDEPGARLSGLALAAQTGAPNVSISNSASATCP
jgi:hypothetical protein